jgi:hypothetical protein
MNRFHVRFFSRSGTGSIPSSKRMLATRGPADLDRQSGSKGVADLRVAPAEIGQSHVDHKLPNVLPFPQSTDLAFQAVVRPRRQLTKRRR